MESKEEFEQKFSNLIREELSNKDFWDYVSSWLDGDFVAEMMEDWDIKTKKEAYKEIVKKYFKGRVK